jgi:hypothetical protein
MAVYRLVPRVSESSIPSSAAICKDGDLKTEVVFLRRFSRRCSDFSVKSDYRGANRNIHIAYCAHTDSERAHDHTFTIRAHYLHPYPQTFP